MPFESLRMDVPQDTSSCEYFSRSRMCELAKATVVGKEIGNEILKAWLEVLLLLVSSIAVRQGKQAKPCSRMSRLEVV